VLPAWATVAIAAISGAAGIAGGVIATWMRISFDRSENVRTREHEREQQTRQLEHDSAEEWRDRRIRAADDFSTGIEQATLSIRSLIGTDPVYGNIASASERATHLVEETVARLARIKLLFGEESEAARVGKDVVAELDLVRKLAVDPRREGTWEALAKVYALHASFNDEVLAVVHRAPSESPSAALGSSRPPR
jgi:hypothetical protein